MCRPDFWRRAVVRREIRVKDAHGLTGTEQLPGTLIVSRCGRGVVDPGCGVAVNRVDSIPDYSQRAVSQ